MTHFEEIYDEAHAAGMKAVEELRVIPMIVGQETHLFSGKIDYSKPTEYVADGVCGFAWINVKPGTSQLAKWFKTEKRARKDEYYGGVTMSISMFNQSLQKKETYAAAFAKVFRDAGFDRVYSYSRID